MTTSMRAGTKRATLIGVSVIWVTFIIGGMAAMYLHMAAPSALANAPCDWPAGSQLQRQTTRATLVMFIHPGCPCTKAGLTELSAVQDECGDRFRSFLVFEPYESSKVTDSDLWSKAATLPNVTRLIDTDHTEAKLFKARTSGQVLIYDAAGMLIFNGGLTAARGHEGPNYGVDSAEALLEGKSSTPVKFPVFGCSLND